MKKLHDVVLHGTPSLLLVTILVVAAVVHFPAVETGESDALTRFVDFSISAAAIWLLSVLLVLSPGSRGNPGFSVLHLAAALTAVFPLPSGSASALLLMVSFAYSVSRYYRGVAIPFGIVSIVVLPGIMFRPRYAWYETLPSLAPVESLILVSAIIGSIGFGWYHRRIAVRDERHQQTNERLEQSVLYLTEANQALQRYALTAQTTSAQNERNRISREVHDSIGHVLVNIIMMLEAAREYVRRDQDRAGTLLQDIRDEADLGHREMRRALRELRSIDETHEEELGVRALLRLAKVFSSATGIRVLFDFGNVESRVSPDFRRLMYSFFQEGFTNAVRHGRATEVSILFRTTKDGTRIALRDNGVGIQGPVQEGIGIRGMRERLAACGGSLSIENGVVGLTFVATVPNSFVYQE